MHKEEIYRELSERMHEGCQWFSEPEYDVMGSKFSNGDTGKKWTENALSGVIC